MTEHIDVLNLFDIQRFSLHDGPGIRTTVFFKGCPLHCPWCSNPESQSREPQILYMENKCVGCGRCANACPQKAISFQNGRPIFHREICVGCGTCQQACLQDSIVLSGKCCTVEQVLDIVEKDRAYYEDTGGGITLSGGEPLCQPEAAALLLKSAGERGFHRAIETTANVSQDGFSQVLDHTDLFLIDMKHWDKEVLQRVTGGNLEMILSNIRMAVKAKKEVILRVPVIPGFNFDAESMEGIFRLSQDLGVKKVDLLPYHVLGKNKYAQLGCAYPMDASISSLEKEKLAPFVIMGEKMKITVTVGSKRLPTE